MIYDDWLITNVTSVTLNIIENQYDNISNYESQFCENANEFRNFIKYLMCSMLHLERLCWTCKKKRNKIQVEKIEKLGRNIRHVGCILRQTVALYKFFPENPSRQFYALQWQK